MRDVRGICVVLGAALLVIAGCNQSSDSVTDDVATATGVEANGTVTYVVDGDTIDVLLSVGDEAGDGAGDGAGDAAGDAAGGQVVEERIRLIGIDTPETKRPDFPVECFGPEASAFVEELLPVGTPVRVERDVVARDDFGRLLGYVYRADDGLFVNETIVRQGYATPLSIEPNTTFEQVMVEAARAAESDDLGLWQACAG